MAILPKTDNPELEMLRNNKTSGYNYRERRHHDWDENYELYRDKVQVNRLTQRQSVNIPLMKQTIRTLLKDVDDMPVLYFENLDNDAEAEIFKNEYWKWTAEQNNMELQDIVDKKQVFMFGRSFDQWQIADGKVKMEIQDPMDILVDRFMNPFDLHSSRFLIHNHTFRTISSLERNPNYDQEAVARLKKFYGTSLGLIKSSTNKQMLTEKNQKMSDMGVSDIESPVLGETYVELSLHFVYRADDGEEQLYMYVEADDMEILSKKKLEDVIGVTTDHFWRNHFPYNSWCDDIDRQDFWTDGIADIVRTPNKVLNSWFSQLVENRTLRNFGMHYYDSTAADGEFTPQTFTPLPWGWYGVPGKPQDILQKIDIPDLSESLDEMQYVVGMIEKSTGATATQQGTTNTNKITLGEVQLALGEAKARIKGMSKFYTKAWKDRGTMFLKLVEAAGNKLDAVKIHRKGKTTNDLYEKEITPNDWKTQSGYRCKVWSQDEKDAQGTDDIQKFNAIMVNIPNNPKLTEIYQRKLLEFGKLDPDEINEVMAFEEQKTQAVNSMALGGGSMTPQGGLPTTPQQQVMPIGNQPQ